MVIDGIPEHIEYAAYQALLGAAGFSDLNRLRELRFCSDGIYATVLPDGPVRADLTTGEIVEHKVYIPIQFPEKECA